MMLVPRSKSRVTLPIPPSVNNLFATVGGKRVRSRAYKAWLKNVEGPLLEMQIPSKFPVIISVVVFGRLKTNRDLDNLLKPVGDAMVTCNVLPGDSVRHICGWRVDYCETHDDPYLVVEVYEVSGT